MRTKTLLLGVAITALGLAASLAQSNVYSLNVVGYINMPVVKGYTAFANQLDVDGNGNANTLASVFGTNLPLPTTLYAWLPQSNKYTFCAWATSKSGPKWGGDTNGVTPYLQPGRGVFIQNQSGTSNTIVLVGNVMQGSLSTAFTKSPAYNFVGSAVPQAGGMQADLSYVPGLGDNVYTWDNAKQAYGTTYSYSTSKSGPKWNPSDPPISVAQAVFVVTTNNAWSRNFTVQ